MFTFWLCMFCSTSILKVTTYPTSHIPSSPVCPDCCGWISKVPRSHLFLLKLAYAGECNLRKLPSCGFQDEFRFFFLYYWFHQNCDALFIYLFIWYLILIRIRMCSKYPLNLWLLNMEGSENSAVGRKSPLRASSRTRWVQSIKLLISLWCNTCPITFPPADRGSRPSTNTSGCYG